MKCIFDFLIFISFWEFSLNKFGKENIGNWALYQSLTDPRKSPADNA